MFKVRPNRRQIATIAAMIVLLAMVMAAAAAWADDPSSEITPTPSSESVIEAIEAGSTTGEESLTDPAAAAGQPLESLDRDQAGEILEGVFGGVVEAPSGIYDELQGARILGTNVAIMPDADAPTGVVEVEPEFESSEGMPPALPGELSGSGLVSSTVPLLVEDGAQAGEAIDLTLEDTGASLQPSAPLVDVRIPGELGDGIRLPSLGISVKLADAPEARAPSIVEGNAAFYPNVAEDSDFAVSPAPSGFETFSQLRDADSPTTQVYRLGLPEGAELIATEDGGALVKAGDERLLAVQPPAAIDAAGDPVPVELTVDGDTLALEAEPAGGAQFPILVDPLWQTYEWSAKNTSAGICSNSINPESQNSCNNREEWGYEVSAGNGNPPHLNVYPYKYGPPYTPGIGVHAGGSQIVGARGAVVYAVPRYFKENPPPTSYIKTLKVSNMRWEALGPSASPYGYMGIWDYVNKGWISFWSHTGQVEHGVNDPAFVYNFENKVPPNNEPNKNGKFAQLGIWATEATADSYANLYAGYASVELGDNEAPQQPVPTAQTKWVNQSAAPLVFTAKDTGLGVYAMNASTEGVTPAGMPKTWIQKHGCIGVGDSACPLEWKSTQTSLPSLNYEPSALPTGIDYLALSAEDPVGNKSASSWEEVRVDHQAPTVGALSGNLTEQATVGTKLAKYTLNYSASDGDDATAAASPPILGKGTGTGSGQMQRPMDVAVDASGNVLIVDRENNRVEKFDPSGNLLLEFNGTLGGGTKFSDPRSIAVTAAGNIWVAELGAKRLQEFNAKGEFIRKLTYEGNGKFVEPLGVAAGPGETLWVTDLGSHSLYRFKETGTLLSIVSGLPAAALPTGVDVDASGNAWVAEQSTDKIYEFDSTGKLLFSFGGPGSELGQFNDPNGVAVTDSGNILVVDANNNRVQEFESNGVLLRKFSSAGTANSQLTEPRGIAIGPGNLSYIADAANHRIAKWTHVDQNPQSGAAKVEVKVDGTLKATEAPGCTSKNCAINGSWTLNADDYTVGTHKVEVIATDAVGISSAPKTLNIETHGDRTAPTVTLSGTITEQATLGATRPAYIVKVQATDPGPAEERKSGVAKIEILVDGKVKDSIAPGCPSEGCSLNREWTLNSSSESTGWHGLETRTTDAAGKVKTNFREFMIARDEKAPEFQNLAAFYTAPSGWLEQENYEPKVDVVDGYGYGVTSVQLKIDGQVIQSATQSCPSGACSKQFGYGQPLNMSAYDGGAHPAELIATDGAGNIRKRAWTIKVDPEGHIPVPEAEDTLEALEESSQANAIGPSEEEPKIDGTASGLTLQATQEGLSTIGSNVPTLIPSSAAEPIGMEILPQGSFKDPCEPEYASPEAEAKAPEPTLESEFGPYPGPTDCEPPGAIAAERLEGIAIDPLSVSGTAGSNTIVNQAATVSVNTASNVDTITRPLYNGALTFKAIRDSSAPETFSWQVTLEEGQELKSLDPQHVMVHYPGGHEAFSIVAEPAHDAIGATVPTTLAVASGNVVTLTVHHHSGSFVYPVLAGTGWQGGFTSVEIVGPKDEQELREEEERIAQEEQELREAEEAGETTEATVSTSNRLLMVSIKGVGPPLQLAADRKGPSVDDSWYTITHQFKFHSCVYGAGAPPVARLQVEAWAASKPKTCKEWIGEVRLEAGLNAKGWYKSNQVVNQAWIPKGNLDCNKWGRSQPALVHCEKQPTTPVSAPDEIHVIADYRFPPGNVFFTGVSPFGGPAACITMHGWIEVGPNTHKSENIGTPAKKDDPCNWPFS